MKDKLIKLLLTPAETILRVACVLALVALPAMVWSVFDPTVWPVMIALSVGQAIGTCSFVLFLFVVARDIGLARRLRVSQAAGGHEPDQSATSHKPGEPN